MRGAYYNEFDSEKAAWLRELIRVGVIADGEVDERSICDVRGDELRGFTQWHFFAGIGVWSYALRLAGWPDDRPVCTASFPCPSFSCAGKGQGFDDPRHLWPVGERLFGEFRPPVIFGEQSDDAIGYGWLDLVQTSLEKMSYSVGKAVLASASVGAADIRQRLYWVADTDLYGTGRVTGREVSASREIAGESRSTGKVGTGTGTLFGSGGSSERLADHASERLEIRGCGESTRCESLQRPERLRPTSRMAYSDSLRRDGECESTETQEGLQPRSEHSGQLPWGTEGLGAVSRMGNTDRTGRTPLYAEHGDKSGTGETVTVGASGIAHIHPFSHALKGYWADADWLLCTDGRWRPVEPGTFPLAHGTPARLGRLRGYGDAINAEVAKAFITSYMEARLVL